MGSVFTHAVAVAVGAALAASSMAFAGQSATHDAVVALARRALVAENAKKLNGQTVRKVANIPGPASTAAGIVTTRTKPVLITANSPGTFFTIDCNPDEKIISAGYSSNAAVLNLVLYHPTTERTWRMGFANLDDKTATTTLYAVCIR
jgi:hypothetical protein